MRLLLDTHVWLWLLTDPGHVDAAVREQVLDGSNELIWSTVCVWEIAVKYASGKLALPEPPERFVPTRMAATRATPLPVRHEHALRVAGLPPHHRDPFDRLLVAQAQVERLMLVTADPQLRPYDVGILRA